MPHLIIRNIEKDDFTSKVSKLSKDLTKIIGCPEDWITISYVENTLTFVEGVDRTLDNVFVEVKWFDRPDEVKLKVANLINDTFTKNERDIMITFATLTNDIYFENGKRV